MTNTIKYLWGAHSANILCCFARAVAGACMAPKEVWSLTGIQPATGSPYIRGFLTKGILRQDDAGKYFVAPGVTLRETAEGMEVEGAVAVEGGDKVVSPRPPRKDKAEALLNALRAALQAEGIECAEQMQALQEAVTAAKAKKAEAAKRAAKIAEVARLQAAMAKLQAELEAASSAE